MRYTLLASVSALAIGSAMFASPAMAGNVILTGHDNDFHQGAGAPDSGNTQLLSEVNYARNGNSLPVLAIDAGSELRNALTTIGVPFTAVNPSAVTAGMFNNSAYSAFVVASVSTCGGCDNPVGTGTHLATFETAIAAFFDAGGGIVGLAGATDPNAYAYVPESGGTTTAIFASSGFVATAAGLTIPGFNAVNGDQTHNTFAGFASFYTAAETFGVGGPAVTIFGSGSIVCTGASCTVTPGVPEPSTWTMMLLGFAGFGLMAARKRRRRAAVAAA